jgi:hypothetical protein
VTCRIRAVFRNFANRFRLKLVKLGPPTCAANPACLCTKYNRVFCKNFKPYSLPVLEKRGVGQGVCLMCILGSFLQKFMSPRFFPFKEFIFRLYIYTVYNQYYKEH